MTSPILFLARGHSGTRAVSEFLELCGVYMGHSGNRNNVYDSFPFTFDFQRHLLVRNFKYGSGCVIKEPARIKKVFKKCKAIHLEKYKKGRWGFKTCDGMFSFEMYNMLIPNAKYIELVRDSRDVILSRNGRCHLTYFRPEVRSKYWEYFKIVTFGVSNDAKSCKYFVDNPKNYKVLFKNRFMIQAKMCIEHIRQMNLLRDKGLVNENNTIKISYEDFCRSPVKIGKVLCDFLDLPFTKSAKRFCDNNVYSSSIGRWKKRTELKKVFKYLEDTK